MWALLLVVLFGPSQERKDNVALAIANFSRLTFASCQQT
jgi:hypothetical protein